MASNMEKIHEYIEKKENETNSLSKEIESVIWETSTELKILEIFKNDKDLYEYAELKLKDDSNFKIKDMLKIFKLEMKLSAKCPYFQEFQTFLNDIKEGGDVSWDGENHSIVAPESWYKEDINDKNKALLEKTDVRWLRVDYAWNYIKNGGTFYSPTLWNVAWWEWKYKHVCSTWSYNVLWKMGLPKVTNSLNCDLDWSILTKMWLKYIWKVDPNNPEKDWYEPQNWDTAVWPRFNNNGKMTQHQATYINWHWVSDTIQNQMSCYGSKNEPKCQIYRVMDKVA